MNHKITWGSHIPVHEALMDTYDVQGILELGAGLHSTSFFFNNCEDVVSIETDEEWIAKLRESLKEDQHHKLVLHPVPDDISRATRRNNVTKEFLKESVSFWKKNISDNMNYLFIDSISCLRLEALEKLKNKFDIIVFHDANPRGLNNHYNVDILDKLSKSKKYNLIVDETYTQYTGILILKKLDKLDQFESNHRIRVKEYSGHGAQLKIW